MAFHPYYVAGQLVMAVAVAVIVAERMRTLLYRAPIDTAPWLAALRGALTDGDRGEARRLAREGRPAWVARIAHVLLREVSEAPDGMADDGGGDADGGAEGREGHGTRDGTGDAAARDRAARELEVDELLRDFEFEAFQRLRALRILASAGTASGFLGAVVEVIWMLEGDHGLVGLQAGRVEAIAIEEALLVVSVGVAISVVAWVALSVLKKAAVTLVRDVRRVALELEEAPSEGR